MTHKYKPLEVQAFHYDGYNDEALKKFAGLNYGGTNNRGRPMVKLNNGLKVIINVNDYIIIDNNYVFILNQEEFNKRFDKI